MTEITDNTKALINALERIEELERENAKQRELMQAVVDANPAENIFAALDAMSEYLEQDHE